MPGPWSPMELSIPDGVSAIRGVGRPDRGSRIMVLVTTAPSSDTGEEPLQLLAVGGAAGRGQHRVGQPHPGERRAHVHHQWPPARGAPIASSGTRVTPSAIASQRTRSPRKTGPSTQERTIRVAPSDAGDRQHAGHADPDAAGHGLLDGDLRDGPVPPGHLGDRPEHRHRPARVDDRGLGAVDDLSRGRRRPSPGVRPTRRRSSRAPRPRCAGPRPPRRAGPRRPPRAPSRRGSPGRAGDSASQNSGADP